MHFYNFTIKRFTDIFFTTSSNKRNETKKKIKFINWWSTWLLCTLVSSCNFTDYTNHDFTLKRNWYNTYMFFHNINLQMKILLLSVCVLALNISQFKNYIILSTTHLRRSLNFYGTFTYCFKGTLSVSLEIQNILSFTVSISYRHFYLV